MKTRLLGWVAALFALFTATANAATKITGPGGCPFCR